MDSAIDLASPPDLGGKALHFAKASRSRAANTDRVSADSGPPHLADPAPTRRLASYQLYHVARAHRSFTLGAILGTMLEAAVASARRAYAGYRQWRRAAAVYNALRGLDDHTLRDLGFDRSEIRSVAAEFAGEAESARLRVLLTNPGRW